MQPPAIRIVLKPSLPHGEPSSAFRWVPTRGLYSSHGIRTIVFRRKDIALNGDGSAESIQTPRPPSLDPRTWSARNVTA